MWYAVYENWPRFAWYWVPAICEHPNCNKEIDRWMAFACWWEPFAEWYCDRYFCSKHLQFIFDEDDNMSPQCCERCAEWKEPFPYKPETEERKEHVNTDKSWKERREKNGKM